MEDLLHKFQFQLTVSEMNKVMGVVFCFSFIKKKFHVLVFRFHFIPKLPIRMYYNNLNTYSIFNAAEQKKKKKKKEW